MVKVRGYLRRYVATHTVTAGRPTKKLKARRYRKACTGGDMYPIDGLLGDDRYVFLRLGYKPYAGVHGGRGTKFDMCYVFDAEELIRMGAKVRQNDILGSRQYVAFDLAIGDVFDQARGLSNFAAQYDFWNNTRDRMTTELTKDELRWFIKTFPAVKTAWDNLLAVRDLTTFEGDEALNLLRECKRCEVLVPNHLTLGRAIVSGGYGDVSKRLDAMKWEEEGDV